MGRRTPLLSRRRGVCAHQGFQNCAQTGWLVQCRESHLIDFREALLIREVRWRENLFGGFATLNQPPRPRPLRRLRDIFLMGAATPPWPRRGIRSAPVLRVSHRQSAEEGSSYTRSG